MVIKFVAGACFLLPACVLAARPLVTDDARLTTSGSCQLETWIRAYPDSHEFWAMPACNPTGNLEVTFGMGRAGFEDRPATNDYALQLKTLFRPLETNGWGLGLAVGTIQHPEVNSGPNMLGNSYAYVPASWSLSDDKIVLHANLGGLRDKASGQNSVTWGVGGEFSLNRRLLGIAESFGDNHGVSYGQVGARYSLVPNLFQVDVTVGRQMSGLGDRRWLSLGVRFTPERLLQPD